jgi:uncharacterized protein (TIGR02284 family)
MDNAKAVSTLNNLIETLKDGEQGFRTAAEGLTNTETKALFQEYSRERGQMAQELRAEVLKLGGEAESGGSMSGSVHRGWINIKSVVTGKSDASIIAEAERGEDVAKQAYDEAGRAELPESARPIVQQQAARVRAAHDRVRAMERATER